MCGELTHGAIIGPGSNVDCSSGVYWVWDEPFGGNFELCDELSIVES